MKKISIDPRPPINQGIDVNNPLVKEHTEIYNRLLAEVEAQQNTAIGFITMNPYGTAPLSGYCGIWSNVPSRVYVRITDDIGSITVGYYLELKIGANMIPLVGFSPGATNTLTVIPNIREMDEMEIDEAANSERSIVKTIVTDPLPPTDAELPWPPTGEKYTKSMANDEIPPEPPRYTGFPVIEVTLPAVNLPNTISDLYFVGFGRRHHVGFDATGTVRWFTTLDIPAMTSERISNGHFIGTSDDFDDYKMLYEYDMIGRVHKVYILDNRSHHSIFQLPDNNLLLNSENTGTTVEDGLSIIDINTGLELAYYDMNNVMDTERTAIPSTQNPVDWLHINQASFNATNNLILVSARHQGIFAVKADTSELAFILANHKGWREEFQKYLLTPVDDVGEPLYDLNNPEDIDRADKEFWTWGQHAVEVQNEEAGILEFLVLDNGNFRSRDEANALLPINNGSRMVHYKVNLDEMTVIKVFEYGKEEVGNRGYSPFVANAYQLNNGNYFVNFGGAIFDENGRPLTQAPGYSDIVDPLDGILAQGRITIQEVEPTTKNVLFEMSFTSGRYKTYEDAGELFRVDIFSFRARKLSLIP